MVFAYIDALLSYALERGLIESSDVTFCRNGLLEVMGLEGFEQESELFGRLFMAHSEQIEHLRLDFGVVDSDRTASRFVAVDDDIVGLRAAVGAVGVEQREILVLRRGDGNRNAPLPFRADTELTLRRGKDRSGGNQLG